MLFLNNIILNTNICANESKSRLIIILGIILNIIKIPYQSAGLRTVPGAKPEWGGTRKNPKADNEKYYRLDCSAFTNWVYTNAGFGVNSRVYCWGNSIPRVAYSKKTAISETFSFMVEEIKKEDTLK